MGGLSGLGLICKFSGASATQQSAYKFAQCMHETIQESLD
jgi:hypothetical protein